MTTRSNAHYNCAVVGTPWPSPPTVWYPNKDRQAGNTFTTPVILTQSYFYLGLFGWRMIRSRLKSKEQMFNPELSLWRMQARRRKEGPRRNSVPRRNKQKLWLLGSSGWGSSPVLKYLWGMFGIFMAVLTSRGMISQTMYGWWIWRPEFYIKVQIVTKFLWHRSDCWLFFPHLVWSYFFICIGQKGKFNYAN